MNVLIYICENVLPKRLPEFESGEWREWRDKEEKPDYEMLRGLAVHRWMRESRNYHVERAFTLFCVLVPIVDKKPRGPALCTEYKISPR